MFPDNFGDFLASVADYLLKNFIHYPKRNKLPSDLNPNNKNPYVK